jgi:hypothetical protein
MAGTSDVHVAAWQGDYKTVQCILDADPAMAHVVDSTLYGGEATVDTNSAAVPQRLKLLQITTLPFTTLHMRAMKEF